MAESKMILKTTGKSGVRPVMRILLTRVGDRQTPLGTFTGLVGKWVRGETT